MEVEIRVDRTRCLGAGQCVHFGPGVFDQDREAKAITALVDPRLVDAFEGDHGRIDRALEELTAVRSDPARRGRAMAALATVVDDHIRLEETVLFPLALAALARRRTPVESVPGGARVVPRCPS